MPLAKVHIKALWWSYRFTGVVSEFYLFLCLTVIDLVRCILSCVVIRSMVVRMALIISVLWCLLKLTILIIDIALHNPAWCLGRTFERGWFIVAGRRWVRTAYCSDERQAQSGLFQWHHLLISCHVLRRHRVSILGLGRQDFTSLKRWQVRFSIFAFSSLI